MRTEQGTTVKEIMELVDGISVRESVDGRLDFRMYMTQEMKDMSLESLELSQRAYHCMKRAGYDTIGQLVSAINSGLSLKNVRNCGKKSVREIMEKLFLFQYYSLSTDSREDYLLEVVRINVERILR